MKINLNVPAIMDGEQAKDNGKELTLADYVKAALIGAPGQDDPKTGAKKPLSPDEKYNRWAIIKKVLEGQDLTIEEVAEIKTCVGKHYPNPLVVGTIWDFLEANGS